MKKEIWDQLKNTTSKELINALEKDGWKRQFRRGAIQSFVNPDTNEALTIHHHPRKTYGPKLLKMIIRHSRWNEEDLKRLGLIK